MYLFSTAENRTPAQHEAIVEGLEHIDIWYFFVHTPFSSSQVIGIHNKIIGKATSIIRTREIRKNSSYCQGFQCT